MVESLLECLEQCKDSEDIIFDIRGNPGGNSAIWKNGIYHVWDIVKFPWNRLVYVKIVCITKSCVQLISRKIKST